MGELCAQKSRVAHRASEDEPALEPGSPGGYAVWLRYGLSIGSLPLILVDAAGLLWGLVALAITLGIRGSLLRPSSWGRCPEPDPSWPTDKVAA